MTRKPPQEWLIGSLSPSKDGKHYQLPAQNFPTPTRVCNAAMPNAEPGEISRLMQATIRPGSDHRHPSRGLGC